jgi:hypothetical protein
VLLATMVALAALMMAASPAQADELNDDDPVFVVFGDDFCDHNPFNDNCDHNRFNDFCDHNRFNDDCDHNRFNDFCDHNRFNDFCDHNRFNDGFGNNNGFFGNEVDQESQSGDVNIGFNVSNTGDYAFQCTPAIQFGNTGNFQNASSFVQGFGGKADDFEPGGIEVNFAPQQAVDCSNTIQQSSAASSGHGGSGYWY